jgi:hypothetical protein
VRPAVKCVGSVLGSCPQWKTYFLSRSTPSSWSIDAAGDLDGGLEGERAWLGATAAPSVVHPTHPTVPPSKLEG